MSFVGGDIELAGTSSLPFDLDNLSSVISAAGRAGVMRLLRTVALGTEVQRRWLYSKVTAPFTGTCPACFSLR